MAKEEDWSDRAKRNKEKAKADFDRIEAEMTGVDINDPKVAALADYNAELKFMNELNSKHIFVNNMGGRNWVTSKGWNEVTEREELEFLQLDTFKNIYLNRTIGKSPLGAWWLQETRRNTVDGVIFDPSEDQQIVERNDRRYLNLWEGFGVKPKRGCWKRTLKHIYVVLCNSDHAKYEYVIKWLAWAIQNPHKRAEVALVFKGDKGAGKSFLFSQMKKIFGAHGMAISNPSRLTGRFNSHFRNLSFLFCDEVYYPGNKEIEGIIKAIITEEFIDIESKFKDAESIKNRLHIAMCTNNEWVVPATKDERRYFIEQIDNRYAKNQATDAARTKYFTALWGEMDRGGREAMLYDLLNMDLTNWHPREDIPETTELVRQKEMSLNALSQAMKQLLEDGFFPGQYIRDEYHISSEAICTHLEKLEPHAIRFSTTKKADLYKKLGARKEREGGTGKIKWVFSELHEMRAKWNKEIIRSAWDDKKSWTLIKTDF